MELVVAIQKSSQRIFDLALNEETSFAMPALPTPSCSRGFRLTQDDIASAISTLKEVKGSTFRDIHRAVCANSEKQLTHQQVKMALLSDLKDGAVRKAFGNRFLAVKPAALKNKEADLSQLNRRRRRKSKKGKKKKGKKGKKGPRGRRGRREGEREGGER